MIRNALLFCAAVLSGSCLYAGDAPAQKPATNPPGKQPGVEAGKKPTAGKERVSPFASLREEEKWTFEPPINRIDIFYDLEALLEAQADDNVKAPSGSANLQGNDIEQLRAWGKSELSRIEGFLFERKWDDAIKATEADLKKLEPRAAEDEIIAKIVEKMKVYYNQAQEAKIYEEAQQKFDELGLRVEGILWSPSGSLAVINGEPRARAINERVKDCVIINIDTNRVDFLFHYNRRRFEFQRYVGEEVAVKKTK